MIEIKFNAEYRVIIGSEPIGTIINNCFFPNSSMGLSKETLRLIADMLDELNEVINGLK